MKSLPKPLRADAALPWESDSVVEAVAAGLPGVSIVMPVFNAGRFIEKTIRSLMMNDLVGCELILMDGGSEDETMAVVSHYEAAFTSIVSEKDGGQSDAINKGFALATKPILYWLNGDDIILPNALTRVRRAFMDQPDAQVIVGNAYMTELDFTPIRHFKFSRDKLSFKSLMDYAHNHLVQPSVFFTQEAWKVCGPIRDDLHYAMDADLFLHMAKRYDLIPLDVDVAYSVYHADCKTRGKRAESIVELALVQAAHGGLPECKKTLQVLIAEFNNIKTMAAGMDVDPGRKEAILEARIRAMEEEQRRNVEVLLLAEFPEK